MDQDGPVLSPLSLHDGLNLPPKPNPTLMGLPTEVRVQILTYLLTSYHCTTETWAVSPKRRQPAAYFRIVERLLQIDDLEDVRRNDSWYPGATHTTPWQRSCRFFPQVLCVCRQLYADGHELLYQHNQFVAIKHVPAEWRADLMRTGEKIGWWLSKEQFWNGFLAAESAGYDAKQPVMSFTISESGRESRDTYVVLLEDLRMMMSSLQRRLMSEARARSRSVIRRENKVKTIAMEIKDVALPGLVLPNEAKVTTRLGDLCFPWIGRRLSTVRVRGEQMPFNIYRRGGTVTMLRMQGMNYRHVFNMQEVALHRQLEELQLHVDTFGPSMQIVKGLVLVYQQAKDAHAGLLDEYRISSIPFTHLMRTAACRLAYLDVSSIDGLGLSEAVALRRTQVIYTCLAVRFGPVLPMRKLEWDVRLWLRGAVLMHEVADYECADTLLFKAVRTHLGTKSVDPGEQPTSAQVENTLTDALIDSGLPLSVMDKGYFRRGWKLSDFPLLFETWANHAGYAHAEIPIILGNADYMRSADAAW